MKENQFLFIVVVAWVRSIVASDIFRWKIQKKKKKFWQKNKRKVAKISHHRTLIHSHGEREFSFVIFRIKNNLPWCGIGRDAEWKRHDKFILKLHSFNLGFVLKIPWICLRLKLIDDVVVWCFFSKFRTIRKESEKETTKWTNEISRKRIKWIRQKYFKLN